MEDTINKSSSKTADLEWVQLKTDLESEQVETSKEKMIRKIKENPIVPIGCLATFSALSYGLWSFKSGNRKMSQYMMRTRIAAQAFTVSALLVGIWVTYGKKK